MDGSRMEGYLGYSVLNGLSIMIGGATHDLLKLLVEISNGIIAYHIAHLGDGQIVFQQQSSGVANSDLI